jgi:transposase
MSRDVKLDAHLGVSREGYAGRIEVLGGPTGRRQRSDAEKARIAAESLAPDAVVADIARRHGATRWQIYDWRRRFRIGRLAAPEEIAASPAFVPLTVDDGSRTVPSADIIEVMIGDILIRVGRDVDEEHLARIFRAARAAT